MATWTSYVPATEVGASRTPAVFTETVKSSYYLVSTVESKDGNTITSTYHNVVQDALDRAPITISLRKANNDWTHVTVQMTANLADDSAPPVEQEVKTTLAFSFQGELPSLVAPIMDMLSGLFDVLIPPITGLNTSTKLIELNNGITNNFFG
jgi:hypothetical protein